MKYFMALIASAGIVAAQSVNSTLSSVAASSVTAPMAPLSTNCSTLTIDLLMTECWLDLCTVKPLIASVVPPVLAVTECNLGVCRNVTSQCVQCLSTQLSTYTTVNAGNTPVTVVSPCVTPAVTVVPYVGAVPAAATSVVQAANDQPQTQGMILQGGTSKTTVCGGALLALAGAFAVLV